ncbi:MAG: helicase-related protein [Candidatus Helarchaeales archaeon]
MEKITPRDYQINARDQIINAIERENKLVSLVLLPTGMGKTLVSTITIDTLIEGGYIAENEKILFLVQDRKLKHQLYNMAREYGLDQHGHLFLLDDSRSIPPRIIRQHAAMAKFIFATPVLLMNSVISRRPGQERIDRDTIRKIKIIVIDEILDIFAQSYGQKRDREETIRYIEKKFNKSLAEIIQDVKKQYSEFELNEKKIENYLLNEFAPREYRLNKKFAPILNLLGLLDNNQDKIVMGLTASLSQDVKIELLEKTFGGPEKVARIYPQGEDFEDYRPEIQLKKIRVFDEWITETDQMIKELKGGVLQTINKAYKMLTGRERLPSERVLLFTNDLLGNKRLQEKLEAKLMETISEEEAKDFINRVTTHAGAFLLLTVARQLLLENTFLKFVRFIKNIKNGYLLNNSTFQKMMLQIDERLKKMKENKEKLGKKEERLVFWVEKFARENKKVLVLCRFVSMTKYLHDIISERGIPCTYVHGKMTGKMQHEQIMNFKRGNAKILFASERLIEKGTDLPEADVAIYYGTTVSLERYEQSLGRIRSNMQNIKTSYTISYNQTIEDEKSIKRDALFLKMMEKGKIAYLDE